VSRHRLIEIEWPTFGGGAIAPIFPAEDFAQRIARTRAALERRSWTHLAVYGDREHFANLLWLCGLDPRFEEALLILGPRAEPLLLTGIECESYLPVSPLFTSGGLRQERFPPFSLPNIARETGRSLDEILRSEGITADSRVGVAGWKTLDVPAYLLDTIRAMTPAVDDASALFYDAATGLRARATAREIELFEYTNVLASDGLRRVLEGIRIGALDHELVQLAGFNGSPQGCHWGLKTGPHRISLASPNGSRVERGQPLSGNVCYRGANCCRAGWVARDARDLPEAARDYVAAFAGPYFEAMGEWFAALDLGRPSGDLDAAIRRVISPEDFGIRFAAGHLIHFEEWLDSPVWPGSAIPLESGMVFQSDVIPSSKQFYSTRMEDTFVLADAALQRELAPDVLARCLRRREFMRRTLGLPVADSVLPLSNLAGIVPPFLESLGTVLAVES
jgi:Xaa-Pro aminopeptidase